MELRNNDLFKGLDIEEIEDILKNISFTKIKYRKGEILAHEGEVCTSLGVILEGTIEMQRIYCNGKYIVIKKLSKGEVFGEALIFSEKSFYPLTVLAVNDCLIMYIKKEEVLSLCFQNKKILENVITINEDKKKKKEKIKHYNPFCIPNRNTSLLQEIKDNKLNSSQEGIIQNNANIININNYFTQSKPISTSNSSLSLSMKIKISTIFN